ncbi:hypothetical protein E2C01_029718 [Portunus trituberculatus]|uniref:Uncharacterized protein n=1 Tax=Portunus trituberculatus TaxID=210409 RepID=A0A5B7ESP7_PORTR|nr:hypothetical protein [Portunus trituberculatus]
MKKKTLGLILGSPTSCRRWSKMLDIVEFGSSYSCGGSMCLPVLQISQAAREAKPGPPSTSSASSSTKPRLPLMLGDVELCGSVEESNEKE